MNNICFIADRYPIVNYPANTFLEQLIAAIARTGVHCTVIAPYSIVHDKITGRKYSPEYHEVRSYYGQKVDLYFPRIYIPTAKTFLGIHFADIFLRAFMNAVEKTIAKQDIQIDALYGHFINPSGLTAAILGEKMCIPSFFAYGESSIHIIDNLDREKVRDILKNVTGVISVSTQNKTELIENSIVHENKIEVFPNAIDDNLFRTCDKALMREELGFEKDDFIVCFTGHFIERKGSLRLSRALECCPDTKSIFIGKGPEEPNCEGILFKGQVEHNEIYKYLNAADVFVLPTLAEGCCNSIIEAMACGLPIISSDRAFNDDILDERCSIRIDPTSIEAISNAINELKSNSNLLRTLSMGALRKADALKIESRANNILAFMDSKSRKDIH